MNPKEESLIDRRLRLRDELKDRSPAPPGFAPLTGLDGSPAEPSPEPSPALREPVPVAPEVRARALWHTIPHGLDAASRDSAVRLMSDEIYKAEQDILKYILAGLPSLPAFVVKHPAVLNTWIKSIMLERATVAAASGRSISLRA